MAMMPPRIPPASRHSRPCAFRFRRRISFGVVPLEIREWNPLIAPQAMVMKAKGKRLPANTGPVPSIKRVSGGHVQRGPQQPQCPAPSRAIVPSFTKVLR